MTFNEYIENYAQRHKVYWAGGVPWRRYKGVLRPLTLPHIEPRLEKNEIAKVLAESGAPLVMWTYDFDTIKSEWWWIIGERPYSLDKLGSKTRYNIRNGLKHCKVQLITGRFLADNGYNCYRSAMRRHTQTIPLSESEFKEIMPGHDSTEAAKIWGVFIHDQLIGYGVYLIVEDIVNQQEAIFDPLYFRHHSSFALIHTITEYYLNEKKCCYITTGMRSISHETQFEDFITKNFGYRKAYCKLGLEYSLFYGILADIVYHSRALWSHLSLPESIKHKLDIIHKLKQIKKSSPTPSQASQQINLVNNQPTKKTVSHDRH
jgi:hypothetical protein